MGPPGRAASFHYGERKGSSHIARTWLTKRHKRILRAGRTLRFSPLVPIGCDLEAVLPDWLLGSLGAWQHPAPLGARAQVWRVLTALSRRGLVSAGGAGWSGARCVPGFDFPCWSRPPSRRRGAPWDRERSPSEAARWTRDSSA